MRSRRSPGVQEAASAAERAYRSARAPEKFRLLVQPDTGHEFTSAAQRTALDWLVGGWRDTQV